MTRQQHAGPPRATAKAASVVLCGHILRPEFLDIVSISTALVVRRVCIVRFSASRLALPYILPHVAVLLATHNGSPFLNEQLASIAAQSGVTVDVCCSDDASTDTTVAMLAEWRQRWPKGDFTIAAGPNRGFAENFRALIRTAQDDADYFAFCDQDDVWDSDKLETAVAALSSHPDSVAALYCARSRLIDTSGNPFGLSPLFRRRPSFGNALVQSLAAGNTMVFNRAALAVLRAAAERTAFPMHDWWSYLLLTGTGGAVIYDPVPRLGYRQHAGNVIGGPIGLRDRPRRLIELASGRFARQIDRNLAALEECRDMLTNEARGTLETFAGIRRAAALPATVRLARSTIRRQTINGDVALYFAAALGRL